MQITGKNIIGSKLSGKGEKTLDNRSAKKIRKAPAFKKATKKEINTALEKAADSFASYRHFPGNQKARFLRQIAAEIESLGDVLIQTVMKESGLPEGRVKGECGRTTNQLRLFADHIEEGSWVEAVIDHGNADRQPVAKPDIRRMLVPVGPVVVFTASNFPLAFSTAGGDTASALAAGCPVIVKGHEAHPATNELVARAIQRAVKATGMPEGIFSSLNGDHKTARLLVAHPLTTAVAFTGSHKGGRALFDLAGKRDRPIPVFAEMGSVNPIFILPKTAGLHRESIARQVAGSVALGAGQFCTNPGLIFIPEKGHKKFVNAFKKAMQEASPQCMLNKGIYENYRKNLSALINEKDVKPVTENKGEDFRSVRPVAAVTTAKSFAANPVLQNEVFGPFTLLVTYRTGKELKDTVTTLQGQLTASVFGEREELVDHRNFINTLQGLAGRLIINGVPTGVEVGCAMQHGGPYPATTDSRFTSVGIAAIRRFVRPVAWQDFPQELLPPALQDDNPLNIHRMVDGILK